MGCQGAASVSASKSLSCVQGTVLARSLIRETMEHVELLCFRSGRGTSTARLHVQLHDALTARQTACCAKQHASNQVCAFAVAAYLRRLYCRGMSSGGIERNVGVSVVTLSMPGLTQLYDYNMCDGSHLRA